MIMLRSWNFAISRYFAAVARHLNYSGASRRLHVAQLTISQTVLDLEDELGVKLLLRTKRSVQLTAAGTTFLRESEEILRRSTEMQRLAQRAARGEAGALGIGFFGTAFAPILPMLVQTFRRKFPDVELRLYELNPDQQLATAFDDGRIDLGILAPAAARTAVPNLSKKWFTPIILSSRCRASSIVSRSRRIST